MPRVIRELTYVCPVTRRQCQRVKAIPTAVGLQTHCFEMYFCRQAWAAELRAQCEKEAADAKSRP